jgi:peptidyl-prolyl cis-trans isomerase SurA
MRMQKPNRLTSSLVAAVCVLAPSAMAIASGQAPSPPAAGQAASPQVQASSPQIIEQVLVKVNGDIITKTELEERQIGALRQSKISPEVLKNDEQLKKALAEVTPQLLVAAVDELLVIQLGREKGLKLSDEQFNRWLTSMRKDQNLEDDKRFEAALQQEGMTISDIRRNVEKQFLLEQVKNEEFGGKLQITEEEARQYYLANQKEFVDPATVTIREILIEVPTVMQQGRAMVAVGKDDEAAKKADAVRAQLAAGDDFAKVASEVSASASKANGGLIGPIATTELSPDLQKMLEKMKPGEISQPMRAAKGYQILKLETSKESGVRPFDSVRDIVADRVYQERARTEMRKFIERVRRQAIIVWKNEELRKAYEQQVASMSTTNPG